MSADNAATLQVRVIPRARRTEVGGRRGNALVIRIAAAPVDGAANAVLIDFLARLLDVPRRSVTIASGERSRDKCVRIADLSPQQLGARVSAIR